MSQRGLDMPLRAQNAQTTKQEGGDVMGSFSFVTPKMEKSGGLSTPQYIPPTSGKISPNQSQPVFGYGVGDDETNSFYRVGAYWSDSAHWEMLPDDMVPFTMEQNIDATRSGFWIARVVFPRHNRG